jgi:hypothetical protein
MQTAAQQGANGITRTPKYVFSLAVQTPESKMLTTEDLEWTDVIEKGQNFKVAAIPIDRLDSFVAGESARGETTVYCWNKGCKTTGHLKNMIGCCAYGKLKGKERIRQREKTLAEAATGKRRSKVAMGESVKVGCNYGFTVKEFAAKPNVAYIKYPRSKTEVLAEICCRSMQHINDAGAPAHEGHAEHVVHTEGVHDLVVDRLKSGCSVKATIYGMSVGRSHDHICFLHRLQNTCQNIQVFAGYFECMQTKSERECHALP